MYYGEKFNSISHLLGAVLALVGFGALLAISIGVGKAELIIGNTVFGLTLVLLYSMSTLYHSFRPARLKRIFQKLDHISIYLLIAGTYTPIMLVNLEGNRGLSILAFVWALALIGIALETLMSRRIEALQIGIYLLMGWACTIELEALKQSLTQSGIAWLVAGGLLYSFGVIFYVLDHLKRLHHAHGIWHVFVLMGSIAHFVTVIGYVR